MSESGNYKGWNYKMRIDREADGRVSAYTIHFHQQGDDWFDEIRYDSHDRRHGKKVIAPHFHIKLGSSFKNDSVIAVGEIKYLIDNEIKRIRKVIET